MGFGLKNLLFAIFSLNFINSIQCGIFNKNVGNDDTILFKISTWEKFRAYSFEEQVLVSLFNDDQSFPLILYLFKKKCCINERIYYDKSFEIELEFRWKFFRSSKRNSIINLVMNPTEYQQSVLFYFSSYSKLM